MNIRKDRVQRLTKVAQLYYEQDKTQNQIALEMGISRPLVSRMLQEAKALGIVEIRIHASMENDHPLLVKAAAQFGLAGGLLVTEGRNDKEMNQKLAQAGIEYLRQLRCVHLGLGWGHLIGIMVSMLEATPVPKLTQHICPMVGDSNVAIRNYHSNENVRIFAAATGAAPHFLNTPAFAETQGDYELLQQTEHYRSIVREWEQLDTALVNIGNYPSTPDFASGARYGKRLAEQHAVGRLIAYYYSGAGSIIHSDTDYAIQIPLATLQACPRVVGICSANVTARAVAGALRSGLLSHLVVREQVLEEALEIQ